MKDERRRCEEVAEKWVDENPIGKGFGQVYACPVALADLIARERAAAVDEFMAKQTPIDDIMLAWGCTKDIVPEMTAERIRPRIIKAIRHTRAAARAEALEEAAALVAPLCHGQCGLLTCHGDMIRRLAEARKETP
jgi:hypothetical protein